MASPITIRGVRRDVFNQLSAAADRAGIAVLRAPPRSQAAQAVQPFRPGSAVGVGLSTGSISVGAIGTIASSWLHFYIGRWGGSALVQRYGGNTLNRLSRFIGRNDFVASAIVRNVPVSAAIVVNMAFGASHAKFWRFIAGVAVGSVPKIAIVALLVLRTVLRRVRS